MLRLHYSCIATVLLAACQAPNEPHRSLSYGEISTELGGKTSVYVTNTTAFSLPAANMPMHERLNFSVGNSFFRNPWVIAPATTTVRDGLGPLFNANACQSCHIRDGRGHPPEPGHLSSVSMLVRLSIPAVEEKDQAIRQRLGAVPEPSYGLQLQDFAVAPVSAEGQVQVEYTKHTITLADRTQVELRRPIVNITDLAYGPLHPNVQTSARIASPMIGLGLLAAIKEDELKAQEDPEDRNGDGISGRLNRVWSHDQNDIAIGRFGWKAGQPTIEQQNLAAFHGDLGVTSTLFIEQNCQAVQHDCKALIHGGSPELTEYVHKQVNFYSHNLAVPVRRQTDSPAIQRGEHIFYKLGCAACHRPTWTTGPAKHSWLSQQTIHPFTDLMLHDMGPELADGRDEFLATGSEWRTPPLWGLGLSAIVAGQAFYLHDGRARSILEAILWHGGEAAASRNAVQQLTTEERQALLAFLHSL